MKTVGSFEAKTHLSGLLASVEKNHEEILIQKRGANVAVLVSYEDFTHRGQQKQRDRLIEGFREIRESYGKGEPVPVKDWITEGRKR